MVTMALIGGFASFVHISTFATVAAAADLSWITKFASIGDSYAAGLGAADRMDWACSRYGGAYPNLLQASYLGDSANRTHQFLACSGATASEVISKQIPDLEGDLNLLTITAGGNDIGLSPVLNNCIYKFYMAGRCEEALQNARKKIDDGTNLRANMRQLLEAVSPKMNSTHAAVYVTGYASFFGADDRLCDNVTWAVWRDVQGEKPLLKLEMRKQLNDLVQSVNDILRSVTEAAGPRFRFIDYDDHIQKLHGRYCEAGVIEPDPNRKGLDFYEWNTVDTGESLQISRQTGDDVPAGSFEAFIAESVNLTLREHPDWDFDIDKGFLNKSGVRPEGVIEDIIWWMLPDSWKRVFHLRPEAHGVIAQMVVDDLTVVEEARAEKGHLLVFAAAAVGVVVVVLLLALKFRWRRTRPRTSSVLTQSPAYMDDDEATLAEPNRSSGSNIKQYNTFD